MMFACEGQRQKKYLKLRKEEEINQINQQEVLDELIAEEKGLDISAEKLSNLAKRVVNKIGEEVLQPEINKSGVVTPKPTDRILEAIRSGKLSELFERIKGIPASKLTKKQKIIQKDLKDNTMVKEILNEEIAKILDKNIPEEEKFLEVKKAVNLNVVGSEESDELESMASKSDAGSEGTTLTMASDLTMLTDDLMNTHEYKTAAAKGKKALIIQEIIKDLKTGQMRPKRFNELKEHEVGAKVLKDVKFGDLDSKNKRGAVEKLFNDYLT